MGCDAQGNRAGGPAVRVARTGEKLAEATASDHHGRAAGRLRPTVIIAGLGRRRHELSVLCPLMALARLLEVPFHLLTISKCPLVKRACLTHVGLTERGIDRESRVKTRKRVHPLLPIQKGHSLEKPGISALRISRDESIEIRCGFVQTAFLNQRHSSLLRLVGAPLLTRRRSSLQRTRASASQNPAQDQHS